MFGHFLGISGNSLGILRRILWELFGEFFGNSSGNSLGILWCQRLFTFLKVNWLLTFSKSADCLRFKVSQLIVYVLKSADCLRFKLSWLLKSNSYLNMDGIDLFVKILVFVKILSQCTRKEGSKENLNP